MRQFLSKLVAWFKGLFAKKQPETIETKPQKTFPTSKQWASWRNSEQFNRLQAVIDYKIDICRTALEKSSGPDIVAYQSKVAVYRMLKSKAFWDELEVVELEDDEATTQ